MKSVSERAPAGPSPQSAPAPVLEAKGIVKRYGHVEAMRGADFSVGTGEVVSLVGDNGAGKSTLIKILSGAEPFDGGQILHNGHPVSFSSPLDARKLGVETVYQDLALADDLSPTANMFMGREVLRKGLLGRLGVEDRGAMRRRTAGIFRDLDIALDPRRRTVSTLSGGQRQSVAVARAVMWATDIVILDEPTAALSSNNAVKVLNIIRRIADQGLAVVLVSHDLPHVVSVSDRVEVLRLGRRVASFRQPDLDVDQLLAAMTGAMTTEGTRE
jgi:simple sugar transport system ATP-binding protein